MEVLAKPDKSLVDHLLEVYRLGKEIAQQLNLSYELTQRALLACLLHDIGKATESFQKHVRGQNKRAYPHALASLPFILVAEHLLLGRPLIASTAVVSHHSPLTLLLYEGWNPPKLLPEVLDVLRGTFAQAEEFRLDVELLYSKALALNNPSGVLHGSHKKLLMEFQSIPTHDFAAVKTVLHLADWLASSGKTSSSMLFLKKGKESISNFVASKGFTLRKFQKTASNLENSENLRLRAPTGSGKTEALLLWAGNAQRIIYLLPTQATANAMWKRLSKIYGEENVGVSHGRAKYVLFKEWEQKEHEEDEPPLDYRLFASVFAKPVIVATLDQYLIGYMNGKHWEERQILSKNSAVIIDEIHSYEPFTLGILKYVLENEKPLKLALASATLPDVLLNLFGDQDIVEADETFWKRQRYNLKFTEDPIESGIEKAIEVAKKGGKVLIIANTVQKTQDIFEKLRDKWPQTILLHSQFIYRDRLKREEQAMQAELGTILISTQIVEVSLDISYDILLTELAPVDALIQRMGRVNRKGEKPPVNVIVFKELDESSIKVYGKEILDVSAEIIKGLPETPTDGHLVKATNELYNEIAAKDSFRKDLVEGEQNIVELKKSLGNFTIDLGDEEFRSRFVTRKGIFSIDVIPEQFVEEAYQFIEQGKRWKLVELTVPVHGYWTKMWPDLFVSSKDLGYPIAQIEYDPNRGLIRPPKGSSQSNGAEIW